MSNANATISVFEVAQLLNVHVDTVKRWSKAGQFAQPVTGGEDGRNWRFRTADVYNFIRASEEVFKAQDAIVDFLEKLAVAETSTPAELQWAKDTLWLLREGAISFDDLAV